jgi:hypothetical protein
VSTFDVRRAELDEYRCILISQSGGLINEVDDQAGRSVLGGLLCIYHFTFSDGVLDGSKGPFRKSS